MDLFKKCLDILSNSRNQFFEEFVCGYWATDYTLSPHLNIQIYSVVQITKPEDMMELMCDTKHTFYAKVQSTKNIKKILIPPAIDTNDMVINLFSF